MLCDDFVAELGEFQLSFEPLPDKADFLSLSSQGGRYFTIEGISSTESSCICNGISVLDSGIMSGLDLALHTVPSPYKERVSADLHL